MTQVVDFGERLALRRARPQAAVEDLAHELAAGAEIVGTHLTQHVLAVEERLVDAEDPTLVELAERAVRSTAGAMLSALAYGVPVESARPTGASIALLERLGERDDGLAVALRAQRLLHDELWQTWAAFTDAQIADRASHSALLASSTRALAQYTDAVCEGLSAAWPEARRRRRRGMDVPVEELLGRALCGAPDAAADALAALGYPADGRHLAIAAPPGPDVEGLARRLELACATNVLTDGATVWIRLTRSVSVERVARARPLLDLGCPVGLGDPGLGLEGFRQTRQQAADALRIASLRGRPDITRYRDVALEAVLCADEPRARELARIELGPLAGDDDVAVRLRATLAAYLAAGESQVATAQRLFIHEKTVKYRLRQAEALLGCTIAERRAQIGAALMIHRAFGS